MNERIVKKGRKEFRRLVALNGGMDKLVKPKAKRARWPFLVAFLAMLAIAEGLVIWRAMLEGWVP